MKDFLTGFFSEFDYPADAQSSLLADFDKLSASPDASETFFSEIEKYEKNRGYDYSSAVSSAIKAGEESGIGEYPACLLLICCFARHLRELYIARGVPVSVWHDSMLDLKVKALECHKVYGVWGTFVINWFSRFFDMTRFALGRLQFETAPYYAKKETYTKCGLSVRYSDDTVLGVHIPGGGPLPYSEVIDAYKRAYDFYGEALRYDGKLVIECSSWLLYPPYIDILTPGSNLHRFLSDFDVLVTSEDPVFEDCWRLYSKEWDGKPENLQRDTRMQRQFAEYFERGGVAGGGNGVLVFDGEKVINKLS